MATKRARVLYDYDAKDADQLSIKAGQLIEIKGDQTAEGWVLAKSKGNEGYVPATYIEEMAGGPPPKPPGQSRMSGFNMPSTRSSVAARNSSEGSGTGKKPPPIKNNNNALRSPPPSAGGRSSGNSVFSGARVESTTPLKADDAYSIFAYFMEWFGVIGMFLSGLFAFMYGTIIVDPQATISMAFGFVAMLFSAILAALITIFRDYLSVGERPALARGLLFCCCSCIAGGGYPIGILGASTLCCAAMSDFLAQAKEASSAVTSENWAEFCLDCCDIQGSLLRPVMVVLLIGVDVGVFVWGLLDGMAYAMTVSENARTFLDATSWGVATGFGRIVTVNLALIFFFSLFGLQKWLLDRAEANPICCNTFIAWFVHPDSQIFFHTSLAISMTIAVFLHMIGNFAAFENSGPYRSYLSLFGLAPLITGMVAFVLLAIILAGAHKDINRNLKRLFCGTHSLAPILAVLLIFHGGMMNNNNFIILLPVLIGVLPFVVVYLVDVLFRAGWLSAGK